MTKFAKVKCKYIHVNQNYIKQNLKHGTDQPVVTVKYGSKNIYGHEVKVHGESEIVYCGPGRVDPLIPCGARVVIKTFSAVTVHKYEEGKITETIEIE